MTKKQVRVRGGATSSKANVTRSNREPTVYPRPIDKRGSVKK